MRCTEYLLARREHACASAASRDPAQATFDLAPLRLGNAGPSSWDASTKWRQSPGFRRDVTRSLRSD